MCDILPIVVRCFLPTVRILPLLEMFVVDRGCWPGWSSARAHTESCVHKHVPPCFTSPLLTVQQISLLWSSWMKWSRHIARMGDFVRVCKITDSHLVAVSDDRGIVCNDMHCFHPVQNIVQWQEPLITTTTTIIIIIIIITIPNYTVRATAACRRS
jgi:hypothetical protein